MSLKPGLDGDVVAGAESVSRGTSLVARLPFKMDLLPPSNQFEPNKGFGVLQQERS